MLIKGTSRATCVSALGQKICSIKERFLKCKQKFWNSNKKSDVYDLLSVGPRNRFTILTSDGPVLAHNCGYGGGVGAFHSMAAIYGVEISDDDAQKVVDLWRSRNPKIKKFWYDLDAAASKAIITGTKQYCGKVAFFVEDKFLKLQLPSGRCLHYYEPRLEEVETPWGRTKKQVTFMAPNPKTRKWERERTWGGTFSENICQGISRDILFYAMRKARTRRYTSVGSTYDEIIAEVPNNPRFNLEDFNRIISENPPWAPDLPLAVEGFECINYTK